MSKEALALNVVNNTRMIGLGAPPDQEIAQAVLQCGFTQVPVIEYVTWTANIPMSDLDVDRTFGNKIDVLNNEETVPGIDQVDSSFVHNGILQTDMLVIGFGIHMFGEPLAFSTTGNAMTPLPGPATDAIVSADVWTLNDLANNALGTVTSEHGTCPATLQWGNVDWEALWHMANGYQFQWIMQQRYLLFNELAADVAYFGPYADAVAAGTSDEPVQPFVRRVNDRYRALAAGGIFLPVDARRIGSITVGQATNVGAFHPTRDFDLAPTTFGGIRNQGATGCCNPFRKLMRPVLLNAGIPIGMVLREQDEFHATQMRNLLKLSGGFGGNLETISVDSNLTCNTIAGVAGTTFAEVTLDPANPGNTVVSQRVQTCRCIFKGGTLKIAVLIKGFELWGEWKQYIVQNWQGFVTIPGQGAMGGPGMLPAAAIGGRR